MENITNVSSPRSAAPEPHDVGLASASLDPGAPPGVLPHLVDFFDTDHDGKISISESVNGLRRLGIGRLGSFAFGLGINLGLGAFIPDNPFALDVGKMHKGKHPNDTGVLDEQGRFGGRRFEEVFRRYGGPDGDALSGRALARLWLDDLLRDLRPLSLMGATAAVGELGLLYYVGGQKTDRGTVLTKQRMHDFYTRRELFEEIAREQEAARAERSKTLSGKLVNAFREWIV